MVDGPPLVFLGKELLHFPVALLGTNTELEILFRNRIPVLIPEFSDLHNKVGKVVMHTL